MTPVISPWVFYLMSVVDGLQTCIFIGLGVCVVAVIACLIGYSCEYSDAGRNKYKTAGKKLIAPVIALGILMSLVPSSTTITKMIIAQNVTYERVEAATDTVETVYNDIMELFETDEGDSDG